MALGAAHQMRAIDRAQAIAMLDKFAADDGKKLAWTATLVERYTQAMTCATEVLRRCAARIAAGSVVNLERRDLVALVKALQPDWQEHYTLDAEFLGKLTKVEIMAVADELGITAQLGDGDLYIEIFVETPMNLNSKQKDLLKKLAEDLVGDKTNHSPESSSFMSKMKDIWTDLKN